MVWRNEGDGQRWHPRSTTLGLFVLYQRAPDALWQWVVDARGERARLDRRATPADVLALGVRCVAYQVIPFGPDGEQSQDAPQWIPAAGS